MDLSFILLCSHKWRPRALLNSREYNWPIMLSNLALIVKTFYVSLISINIIEN